MLRFLAVGVALLSLGFLVGAPAAAQAQKNQMVKGTIKIADPSKDLLVINQKVKNETVDRELSILSSTEFVVKIGNQTKEATGNAGLRLLENAVGSSVNVKCDKDVNVLKVTVTIKK